jgi:hypothetical protein
MQNATITQSAVPLRTHENSNQRGVGKSLYASYNAGVCRDLEITITITANNVPPTSQQYTKVCRTEQGWKQINGNGMGGKYTGIRWKDTFRFSILWNLKILSNLFLVQNILLG